MENRKERNLKLSTGVVLLLVITLGSLVAIWLDRGPQSETISGLELTMGGSVPLNWHLVNPPRPGLTCWAAEVSEGYGYRGYGYSYLYCEPSS